MKTEPNPTAEPQAQPGCPPAQCSASGLSLACVRCGNLLSRQGGLMFSPPDREQRVKKIHLCRQCWEIVELWLKG